MDRSQGRGPGRAAAGAPARAASERLGRRPDPFEDIPAPPLRGARAAEPPALAKPHSAPGAQPPQPLERPGANGARAAAKVLRMPRQTSAAPREPDAADRAAAPTAFGEAAPAEAADLRSAPALARPARAAEAGARAGIDASAPAWPAAAEAAPAIDAAQDTAPAARGRAELRRAVTLGLVIALALVGAAVMLGPGAEEAPAPVAAEEAAAALGSGPVPATEAPATGPGDLAVRLRVGPGLSDARQAELRGAVEAAGYGAVEVRALPFPVERSRIEFFSPDDRSSAEALARALAPLTGELAELRDLAGVVGGEAGRLEAWLAETADE